MHVPVLTKEVLRYLNPEANENFIDATIGEAGHTAAILEKNNPNGRVLGIEWDTQLYELTKSRVAEFSIFNFQFSNRLILVNNSYADLKKIVERENFMPVNGILLDLGMSSWQLEESKRGFSFMKNEALGMRYNPQNILTAEKIVNEYPESEIEKILREYGEERFARQIAKKIEEKRKIKRIKTTFELVNVIKEALPPKFHRARIHFATRAFQAIRIAVNGELDNLKDVLPQTLEILSEGGRLVIISFHSLEDRIVKNFFKNKSDEGLLKILTKKPIMASEIEALKNPRARSAKLRAIIKI